MPEALTVTVENARLFFKNFSGKEGPYNREGDRNFCCELPEDVAEAMERDGWNIRYSKPQDEGDVASPYIQVTVRFDIRPPRIVMIADNKRTNIDESTVDVLDYADIALVDLIIRARNWEHNGKTGIKAYLQTMFVTIREDELERKYAVYSGTEEE